MRFVQLFRQRPFAVVIGRKRGMPAFPRQHFPALVADRDQRGHADARSGATDEDRVAVLFVAVAFLEQPEVTFGQFRDRTGHGRIVIDQPHALQPGIGLKPPGIDNPVAIGQLHLAFIDWPGQRDQRLWRRARPELPDVEVERVIEGLEIIDQMVLVANELNSGSFVVVVATYTLPPFPPSLYL